MADKEKQSFVVYRNWMEMIMGLPDEQALDLARSIFAYCLDRDYESGSVASAIFATIHPKLDEDRAEWERICELRRQAGAKGGKQKVANAKQMLPNAKQMVAKDKHLQTDTDTDTDNEYDTVTDTEYDNDVLTDITKKEDAKASKKEVRHKYGQYENVLLSDTDIEKLKDEFPMDWQERIERLSEYIESKGAKYKNHLATIRAWARKNNDRKRPARSTLGDILNDMPFDSSGDITGSKVWEVFNK